MSDRPFLDTNVFVYSFDRQDTVKAEIALDLIARTATRAAISFQVIQEFFSVAGRRFPTAMTPQDAARYLKTVFGQFAIVHSSLDLYPRALTIRQRYRLSWYDSLIVAAAAEAKCSILYTEDLQHGMRIEGMRIDNPFRDA